jgi:hypothetical protein
MAPGFVAGYDARPTTLVFYVVKIDRQAALSQTTN